MKRTFALLGAIVSLGACVPAVRSAPEGLPPIPKVRGPLDIRVIHPTPDTPLPGVDSTFVFGSVGTGRAELAIDGVSVPVAPNGAFLAYLAVPDSGVYHLVAERGGDRAGATAGYRLPLPRDPAAPAAPRPDTETFARPLAATVVRAGDTLATGSDAAAGSPTPTADRVWQLPRGARLAVTGRRGDQLRARLAPGIDAWFADTLLVLDSAAAAPPSAPPIGRLSLRSAPGWVDLRLPVGGAPFLVHADARAVGVTVYGRTAPAGAVDVGVDPLLASASWAAGAGDSARLELALARPLWGYKAFYDPDGTLVVRLRRAPGLDPAQPLRGLRVVVDAGHPPGGATGPTGLAEAEANLAVALRLANRLRERGAEPILTRTTGAPLASATSASAELGARVELAVRRDAELLVSVHNNAFPEGINPFVSAGTEAYYFYPFAADLAEALNREIAEVTRVRNLGAKQRSLALVRPAWMPSVLTESLFLMVPEQEAALRDPEFLDRLADAHLRGIEAFLRQRLPGAP